MSLISDEAVNFALMKELCSGRALMETMQSQREMAAAKEAAEARKHGTKNWKLAAVIPQHEYFILGQKYGMDCWNDRGFIKDFQKTQPHLAVSKI